MKNILFLLLLVPASMLAQDDYYARQEAVRLLENDITDTVEVYTRIPERFKPLSEQPDWRQAYFVKKAVRKGGEELAPVARELDRRFNNTLNNCLTPTYRHIYITPEGTTIVETRGNVTTVTRQ